MIELPRIVESREFTIETSDAKIEVFSDDETSRLLNASSRTPRLFFLLMLNTGMLQGDIANLRQDEVDWENGRITRKRSKTRKNEKVPEVSYPLWPETFELLKKYRSDDSELALLNRNGSPLKTQAIVNGKVKKTDTIRSAWRRVSAKAGLKKPLKLLRKTSATHLGGHVEYSRYAQHFLGHAPRTMADRHYVTPSQQKFDEAVRWLGKQYNLEGGTNAEVDTTEE